MNKRGMQYWSLKTANFTKHDGDSPIEKKQFFHIVVCVSLLLFQSASFVFSCDLLSS